MTQFEDVAISILPVIERGKIVAYAVNRRQGMRQPHWVVHRFYMGARQRRTSAKCSGTVGGANLSESYHPSQYRDPYVITIRTNRRNKA
jgi:hypothetical protein